MKFFRLFSATLVFFVFCTFIYGQQLSQDYFDQNREVYFKFTVFNKAELSSLTRIISIDNVKGNEVYAYANFKEYTDFLNTGYEYTVLPHPGDVGEVKMASRTKDVMAWNTYPTYEAYVAMMTQFASDYPNICQLIDAGTTVNNRKILFVKISDNVAQREAEPQFMYTSTMHGDETTGYVLMLRLIDSLLTSYGNSSRITNLINNAEIWINPNGNPDGTYYGGNNTVNGARRYNGNGYDINRNFRDPDEGENPSGPYQPETIIMMNLADQNNFVLSCNFHGGAEVVNYPWDTWSRLHADDNWFQYISRQYADTVHAHSPSSYMSGFDDGITNGYAWYRVVGGRQDYYTYFARGREITIEISDTKLLSASLLPAHWEYNKRSFLNHMEQCLYGVRGIITNQTGAPIKAEVSITGHDIDNSSVFSSASNGNYHRPIKAGTYNITFSADGYTSQTFNNIVVTDQATVDLNVQLISPALTDWQTTITINDAAGLESNQAVVFGKALTATNGIDASLGEVNITTNPTVGVFDVRFLLPDGSKSLKDFRNRNLSSITWDLKFQPGPSGYPITFKWDPNTLPPGDFYLSDQISGSLVHVDMKSTDTFILNNASVTALNIEYSEIVLRNVVVQNGWNIISIPSETSDMSVSSLFPGAESSAFEYKGSYNAVTTFENGKGYWLKFNSAGITPINGAAVGNIVTVNQGWNLIGPFDRDLLVANITTQPAGLLVSDFFGYNASYFSEDTLKMGKGYWIKTSQSGELIFNNYNQTLARYYQENEVIQNASLEISILALDGVSSSTISLFAGLDPTATNNIDESLGESDLPPAAPGFDVRFVFPDPAFNMASYRDYRNGNAVFVGTYIHRLIYQLESGSPGLTLNISIPPYSGIELNIQDLAGGSIINQNFYEGDNVFSNPITVALTGLKLTITYNSIWPVELTAFTAASNNNIVELNWQTATEQNNLGFDVERKSTVGDWMKVGFIEGHGTTSEISEYRFFDNSIRTSADKILYRLKQIDYDGTATYSDEVSVSITPSQFSLEQNYPNPFNPKTFIIYSLAVQSHVRLSIYDILGNEVAELVDGNIEPGVHKIDFYAENLSSGIYLYRITAEGIDGSFQSLTRKMLLMK
ncbi:MAG: M14 family zinc carboxypeptidase [bacterium]